MASVSIISEPQLVVPIYNDTYLTVTSPQSTNQLFNFLFDVYTGSTSSPYILRLPIPAGPNGACDFNPFGILQDYIGYDLTYDLVGWQQNICVGMNYVINIGVEYATNQFTGTTLYPALSTFSGFTWGGALRYEQYSNLYSYVNWVIANNTRNFLTNTPDSVIIQNNEMASISVLNNPLSAEQPTQMLVQVYQNSGGTRSYWVNNKPVVSGTSTVQGSVVEHFGSGIWNLNQLTSANTLTASSSSVFPIFNPNTDYQYSCQVYWVNGEENTSLTKQQFYVLDTQCTYYNSVRLMWRNPFGVFDFYTYKLVSILNTTATRNTYEQTRSKPNYVLGDRGTTTTYNTVQEGMTINSDWIDDATSAWLSDCFDSDEVYMLNPDGTIYPINFITTPNTIGRFLNNLDQVNVQIQFNFSYPVYLPTGTAIRSHTSSFGSGGPHTGTYANYPNRGGYAINISNSLNQST
jgi:hypothetical protein